MNPYDRIKQDFSGKRVLVFGLGVQGRGVEDATFFHQIGAKVHVTDSKSADRLHASLDQLKPYHLSYTLGQHLESDITSADIILRNASVPWNHPLLELARSHHIPIYMDAQLFFQYAKPHAIGVTGTRGKSTTSQLVFQIIARHLTSRSQTPTSSTPNPFLSSCRQVILAGNAVNHASLPLLTRHRSDNLYVFELSSWQLQAFAQAQLSPQYALITNIYPDHLVDRSFTEYIADKTAIFTSQNSQDYLFLNAHDEHTASFKSQALGNVILYQPSDIPSQWHITLPGEHNRDNIAAAISLTRSLGVPDTTNQAVVESFGGLPFRLQPIATHNQITYINDTTSTTPIATIKALHAYPNSILILGGSTKHLPIDELAQAINLQAKKVILMSGSGTDEVKEHIDNELIHGEVDDLASAVNAAQTLARPQDIILFSPGFTSFGLFSNEFERGHQFNQIVAATTQPQT